MLSFWRRQPAPAEPTPPVQVHRRSDDLSLATHTPAPDRVTYATKSDKVNFVCNFPANSKHLAEAQNLSVGIFMGTSAKMIVDGDRQISLLLTDRETDARVEPRRSSDKIVELPNAGTVRSRPPKLSQRDRHSPATTTSPRDSKTGLEPQRIVTTSGRHSPQSIAGHKHTSATHETYVLRNGQGRELFAAAPIGSQIAKVHDGLAAQNNKSKEPRRMIDDSGRDRWVVVEERAP